MPTFNGEAYIAQALESVENQRTEDIEVIAVDDGSSDQTLEILAQYSRRLHVHVVRRRVGNWAANVNHGLSIARGEYVSILHQDDIWHPTRLTHLRRLTKLHPEATLFIHPSWFIDNTGKRLGPWRCPLPSRSGPLLPETVLERLLVQNFIAMPAPFFPRKTFESVGGMDSALWFTPDWDLWLKLASAGPTVYSSRFLADFRLHSSSQTLTRSHDLADFRRQHAIVLQRHLHGTNAARSQSVRAAIALSVEVNTALAAAFHGQRFDIPELLHACVTPGIEGWWRYLRDSRLAERVFARLYARCNFSLPLPSSRNTATQRRAA